MTANCSLHFTTAASSLSLSLLICAVQLLHPALVRSPFFSSCFASLFASAVAVFWKLLLDFLLLLFSIAAAALTYTVQCCHWQWQ